MTQGKPHDDTLATSVRAELARLGGAAMAGGDISRVVELWPAAVGPAIAANAWPARFARDGSLIVHASSSAWAFELTQLEPEIRARLDAEQPAAIRFVPGPLPEAEIVVPKAARDRAEASPAAHRQAAALAAEISDSALRELVARAALASLLMTGEDHEATGPSGRLTES